MSRPPKKILLIDAYEDRRGSTRFVLETMGHYHVTDAPSVYAAAEIGHEWRPELLLGYAPVSEQYLIEVAAGLDCPWMYVAPALNEWPSMADVQARIKVATARKRGPKPGPRKMPVPVPVMVEAVSA
jgi:hypothetical protein